MLLKRDQIGLKMDQKGLEIDILYQKYILFSEVLFAEHSLSEEITLNEIRFRGTPTIDFALVVPDF